MRLLIALLAGVGLAGCTSSPPAPRAPEVTPQPAPTTAPPPAPPWSFRYAPGEYLYDFASTARIRALDDTANATDSIGTSALLTYRIAAEGDRLLVSGRVDSFTVASGARIGAGLPGDSTSIPAATFSGSLSPRGEILEFTAIDSTGCGAATGAMVAMARSLFVAVPPALAPGATWEDTTSATVCRGGLPVTTTAVRRYRVRGLERVGGGYVVEVTRDSEIQVAGSRTSGTRLLRVSGRGNARATLTLDPITGRLLTERGTSRTQLQFESGAAVQSFVQEVGHRVQLTGTR